ncbi:hypothetical protein, partial [Rhizobium phaseoli]|uniref:hypothetical protein n=1 Tax=Rhizobium phaseoli TaxID=396 RepID=UPI001AED0396
KSIFEERDHVRHCGAAEEGPQAAVPPPLPKSQHLQWPEREFDGELTGMIMALNHAAVAA